MDARGGGPYRRIKESRGNECHSSVGYGVAVGLEACASVIEASREFLRLRVPMILIRLNKGSCQ